MVVRLIGVSQWFNVTKIVPFLRKILKECYNLWKMHPFSIVYVPHFARNLHQKLLPYPTVHYFNILLILEYCAAISSLTSNNGNIDFLSKIATLLFFDVIVLGIKNVLLMVRFITNNVLSQTLKIHLASPRDTRPRP